MMEGPLDEVDSLVMPDLSTSEPEWCESCQKLRLEVKKLKEEQSQSFGKLKQKIISTDLLIKKYKSKCEDYDVLCKKNEEATKRAEKLQRQSEILETQLKAALLDVEPLRTAKATLEKDLVQKTSDLQILSDKVLSAEGSQRQYEYASKAFSADVERLEMEKKELLNKVKTLESGKVSKEASKEFKNEISNLKKENCVLQKNEKRLEKRLKAALSKNEDLTEKLKQRKLSPLRGRRRSHSGGFVSPSKSPVRSPRKHKASPIKHSPAGVGRARTISEKSSSSVSNKEISFSELLNVVAPSDEDTSSSLDDTASISSVRWLFSPIVDCLSPLPQSPACFANRKGTGSPVSDLSDTDEDNLSDIADELEQQLMEDAETDKTVEEQKTATDTQNLEPVSENCKSKQENTKQLDQSVELDNEKQELVSQGQAPLETSQEILEVSQEKEMPNQEAVIQAQDLGEQRSQTQDQTKIGEIQEGPATDTSLKPFVEQEGKSEVLLSEVEVETRGFEAVIGSHNGEFVEHKVDETVGFTPVREDLNSPVDSVEETNEQEGFSLFDIEAMENIEQDKCDKSAKDSTKVAEEDTIDFKENVSKLTAKEKWEKDSDGNVDRKCDRSMSGGFTELLDFRTDVGVSAQNETAESETCPRISETVSANGIMVDVKPSCSYHNQDESISCDKVEDSPLKSNSKAKLVTDSKAKLVSVEMRGSEAKYQESFEFEVVDTVATDTQSGSIHENQELFGANNATLKLKSVQEAKCSPAKTCNSTPDSLEGEDTSIIQCSRSTTASVVSFGCSSPVSPLPMSPFEFIVPISPLPPSPVRAVIAASPTLSEQIGEEDSDNTVIENVNEDDKSEKSQTLSPGNMSSEDLKLSPLPALVSPIKTPKLQRIGNKTAHPRTCKTLLKPHANHALEVKPIVDSGSNVKTSPIGKENLKKLVSPVGSGLGKGAFTAKKPLLIEKDNSAEMRLIKEVEDSMSHGVASFQHQRENENKTAEKGRESKKALDKCSNHEKGGNKISEDAPSGKDSILSLKRRVRLAHQPNVSAVKRQKIQIIEPPVLPAPTVGRKRKNVEVVTPDQDKKPVRVSMFKKRRNRDDKTDRDGARKMQGFLKSSDSAETFVTKETAGNDNPSAMCYKLIDSCLECLSRVKSDSLQCVYEGCEAGVHKQVQAGWPFLNDVEKQALHFVNYLIGQKDLRVSASMIKVRLWERVFSQEVTASMMGKMSLCRLFIAISAVEGDLEQARVFFYNIATCGYLNVCLFMVPVASVWPAVLQCELAEGTGQPVGHGLGLVLENIVTKMLVSQDTEMNRKILSILQKLCQWKGDIGNQESLLKILLDKLLLVLQEDCTKHVPVFELTKAVELLCVSAGWRWFRDCFIYKYGLQTTINKYKSTNTQKHVPAIYVCTIIRITGAVLSRLSDVKMSDIKKLLQTWIIPLMSKIPADVAIRDCCLETLLELSTVHYAILPRLQSWYVNYPSNLSQQMVQRLDLLQQEYTQKFGLVCGSFVQNR